MNGDRPLFIGSYGHRYGDPCQTSIGFSADAVETSIDESLAYEAEELRANCDHDSEECGPDCADCGEWGACNNCDPDLVTYGVSAELHPIRYGFLNLREAKGALRDIRDRVAWGGPAVSSIFR